MISPNKIVLEEDEHVYGEYMETVDKKDDTLDKKNRLKKIAI